VPDAGALSFLSDIPEHGVPAIADTPPSRPRGGRLALCRNAAACTSTKQHGCLGAEQLIPCCGSSMIGPGTGVRVLRGLRCQRTMRKGNCWSLLR